MRRVASAVAVGIVLVFGVLTFQPDDKPDFVVPPGVLDWPQGTVPEHLTERWRWVQKNCQPGYPQPACGTLPPPAGR